MAVVSRKCQYALRVVLELARDPGAGPFSMPTLESNLGIPPRTLEAIVPLLRKAGIVRAHRGRSGGYSLALPADSLTVGRIIRLIDGPQKAMDCQACEGDRTCTWQDDCAFADFWQYSDRITEPLYDATTFQHLLEQQGRAFEARPLSSE